MHQRNRHCTFCGKAFDAASPPWPRTCAGCHETTLPVRSVDLPTFVPTHETSERVVLRRPEELAFAAHSDVVRAYFAARDVRLQG